eukprot:2328543-Ditylum_brightwellii.AAC.1
MLDRGREFTKDFIVLVWDKYSIKQKPLSTRNPKVSSVVERAHQSIDNLLHALKLGTMELDSSDQRSSILSAVMCVLRSTIHTTHKATPMQLVFCKDTMLDVTHN